MRKVYGIDPDTLNDDEWCKRYAEYLFINKLDFNNMKTAVLSAAIEVLSQILPQKNSNGIDNNTMDS